MGRPKTGEERHCERCGKIKYFPIRQINNQKYFYCSKECLEKKRPQPWNKGITKQEDPRLQSISKKSSEQMKREYENGTRDKNKIVQKAHEAVRRKSQERFLNNPNKTISKRSSLTKAVLAMPMDSSQTHKSSKRF